ncbi:MAG: thermonuclease family protein [Pseudomonadota bacterium]
MDKVLISCALLSAVDGDTITCDGQNFRLLGDGQPFVSGVDAPELGARSGCLAEDKLGQAARARTADLLGLPGLLIVDSGKVDLFGRPLVRVELPDGKTIGATLIAEDLARPWVPGAAPPWCETP